MAASYPTSIKSFPAKANGDYVLLTDVTDLELEVVALETALKTGPTALASASLSGATASEAVFTNSTKELVSNSITGSGNVVMSASPTLTGTIAAAAATCSVPLIVASGGTGLATLTDKNVLIGAGTGTVAGVAPGSSGNVLTSDGTDWASSAAPAASSVAFPATQVASADANTLDDYEEGTWTPVLAGNGGVSGQTYATQAGNYVKVGRHVIAGGTLNISATGTLTTYLVIKGLPFTSGGGNHSGGMQFTRISSFVICVNIGGVVNNSLTQSEIRFRAAASSVDSQMTSANLDATTGVYMEFVINYIANA